MTELAVLVRDDGEAEIAASNGAVPLRRDANSEIRIESLDAGSPGSLLPVLFADGGVEAGAMSSLGRAGSSAVILDVAGEGRLLKVLDIPALARLVDEAHAAGLRIWLAGKLEAPDVTRLLPLRPDGLVFDAAVRKGHTPAGELDPGALRSIRAMMMSAQPSDRVTPSARVADSAEECARAPGLSDRVFIRDFILPVRIGVYEHEKAAAQRVRFDVEVEVAEPVADMEGMRRIFSYDLITDSIRSIVAAGHLDFVETLAERIAGRILAHPRARRVKVRVEKLEIGPGGVGVEIVREPAGSNARSAEG